MNIGRRIFTCIVAMTSLTASGESQTPAKPATSLTIEGWPFLDLPILKTAPPSWLGDDPALGRLACPSLTRLNLTKLANEPVLLRGVNVSSADQEVAWRLDLRPGLRWWGGDEITGVDLANFLQGHLPEMVKERGLGIWAMPGFKIDQASRYAVMVRWQNAPAFGPYVLDSFPLWRASPSGAEGSPKYECAGLYEIRFADKSIRLTPAKGYKSIRTVLDFVREEAKAMTGPKLSFGLAESTQDSPAVRMSDKANQCPQLIDLPFVSVISWNTKSGIAKDPELRKILTQLTPRGELLRAGAAHLGDLLSAPIPRSHPGYNRSVLVRSYSVEQASAQLDKLGLRRERSDGPRLDGQKRPLRLTLASSSTNLVLVEKVIADAFALVGIAVDHKSGSKTLDTSMDGVITSVMLPWPSGDFIGNFHSRADQIFPFWSLDDKQLDRLLERYAVSLTQERPDFSALQDVHSRIFDLEPMTILLQHRACLKKAGTYDKTIGQIDGRDPDWFRRLVL